MATTQKKASQANTFSLTPPVIIAAVIVLVVLLVAIIHGVSTARASSPTMDPTSVQAHESAKKNNPNLN